MDDDDLLAKIDTELQPWLRAALERALAAGPDARLQVAVPRQHLATYVAAGWDRDEFGTCYWPASEPSERDAVAAIVAGWDLAALGVTP